MLKEEISEVEVLLTFSLYQTKAIHQCSSFGVGLGEPRLGNFERLYDRWQVWFVSKKVVPGLIILSSQHLDKSSPCSGFFIMRKNH
jgi:hypothetical protein